MVLRRLVRLRVWVLRLSLPPPSSPSQPRLGPRLQFRSEERQRRRLRSPGAWRGHDCPQGWCRNRDEPYFLRFGRQGLSGREDFGSVGLRQERLFFHRSQERLHGHAQHIVRNSKFFRKDFFGEPFCFHFVGKRIKKLLRKERFVFLVFFQWI